MTRHLSVAPRRPGIATAMLLVVILTTVQGGHVSAQARGPDLVFLDSLVLEETEDHYLGQPLALIASADGSLLVSDGFSDAVRQYDKNGRLLGNLGRKGSGPGEFRNLGGVGFAGMSVIGFVDEIGKIELFTSGTRAHLGSVRLDLDNRPASFAVMRDSLWFAGLNPASSRAMGVVPIATLVDAAQSGGGTELMELTRALAPAPYMVNHPLAMSLAHAFIDVGDHDAVLGFAASPFVLRVNRGGMVTDTIWIARGTRRGEIAEADLVAMMTKSERPQSREDLRSAIFGFYSNVSFVRGISRDDDGNIYTLHQDSNRDDDSNMTAVRLYAAVSNSDGTRQCADTLIPTSDIGVPMPLLTGSTLWILDQRMGEGAAAHVVTVVRRFRIDATRCTGTVRH